MFAVNVTIIFFIHLFINVMNLHFAASQDCGRPPPPNNGVVYAASTTNGGTATYTCEIGYTLSGASTRICDGTNWSGSTPTCVIYDCGTPAAPTDGAVDLSSGTNYRNTAKFVCNMGYDLSGQSSRICQADGTWQKPFPTCVIKDCGTPAAPTNVAVDFSSGTVYLNTATFTCNTGYDLIGLSSRTCQADGSWETPFPTCVVKDCGPLTNPTNGQVTTNDGTEYGDTATYTCTVGYNLVGSSSRSCGADGNWDGAAPSCTPKDCGTPPTIINGAYSAPITTYKSTATYSCNTGYIIVGNTTYIVCQSDGEWSSSRTTCNAVQGSNGHSIFDVPYTQGLIIILFLFAYILF